MNFTFGIITDGKNWDRVSAIIDSIVKQNIPQYEILIIGPSDNLPFPVLTSPNPLHSKLDWLDTPCRHCCFIKFDEQKLGWITRKKNLLAQEARFENLVLLHDYVSLAEGWYEGMKRFGNDWDVCMTIIENLDGSRFRDWIICDDPQYCHPYKWDAKIAPYEYDKTYWMYVSGAYIIVKRDFFLVNPLNEQLFWGQGEDVEWSKRIRHKWNYKLNLNSKAKLLKQQDLALPTILEL